MPSAAATLSLAALALLLPHALAAHCAGAGSSPFLARAGDTYLALDACAPGCVPLVVYRETNDVAGLQRQDAQRDDTCHGSVAPDTRILWGS